MGKKFFVLVALAAMVLTFAAPAAFAHSGQPGLTGPQPVEWTGEEATLNGLLEPAGEKLDGTPTWMMEDEGSGDLYHVEGGEGVDLSAFEGQRVSLHGELGHLEGAVILVDSVEPLDEETATEAQYEPEGLPGETFDGTGTVEYLGDAADGTPVYGLAVSPGEGHAMEGDFDFAAFEGRKVTVTGRFVHYRGGFSYLSVQAIEPVDEKGGDGQTTEETVSVPAVSSETAEPVPATVSAVPVSAAEEAQGTIPAAAPETTEPTAAVAEETVAVELASEEAPLEVADGADTDEPGIFSVVAKPLPITGGMALLLPLAGLALTALGFAAYRMTR